MKIKNRRKSGVLLWSMVSVWFCCVCMSATAQTKTVLHETFGKKSLQKHWHIVNGSWTADQQAVVGVKNTDWAIMTSKGRLPDNYVLTFNCLVDSNAYLLEVMLNLNGEKYLGILLNQLDKVVAIEDRSLFSATAPDRFIRSTGNIGKLPKTDYPPKYQWLHWKIQKTGNLLYIWINDEAVMLYTDEKNLLTPKGRLGFAVNGTVVIKDLLLQATRGQDSKPPVTFEARPLKKYFFNFSE